MNGRTASIIHLNVTDFAASVAIAKDRSLADTAFIIARGEASRSVVIAVSHRAWGEGIIPGMPLAVARRRSPSLAVVTPDPSACAAVDSLMTSIASRYAPTVQNDSGGHIYLDVGGTTRLFGPPVDCAVRIRNEIRDRIGIEPAAAVATNKLVARIGTRTIRPSGIALVREGEESEFLARQDVSLLPGVGPAVGRLLAVAGLSEIGELAALDDEQTTALLGKRGRALRDAARGLDASVVDPRRLGTRRIHRRIDFAEPVCEADAIHAALVSAVEDAALTMRRESLCCATIRMTVFWADGTTTEGSQRSNRPLMLDGDLIAAASHTAQYVMRRRVRLCAFSLFLADLAPAWREPDLFIPEGPTPPERLQAAVDGVRLRFGPASVTRAAAITHA